MINSKTSSTELTGIYNFGEFLSLPLERPKPALAGFLFEGQTAMLAGRFAVGKTLLCTQMTIHMACGKEFLGRTVGRPYSVAFLDCENGPAVIQERVQKQINAANLTSEEVALVNSNSFYLNARDVGHSLYGFQLEEHSTGILEQFLNDCQPDILIVDNLGRAFKGKLEEAEDVTKFFKVVQGVKERCSSVELIVFLHHIRKPSDHDERSSLFHSPYEYLTQMRGSGRLLDFSESRFALAEEKFGENSFFVLNGLARSADVVPVVLEKNDESLSFQLVADKRFLLESLFSSSPRRKELFEAIQAAKMTSFRFTDLTKLADSTGKPFNRGTIDTTLKQAVPNGLLSRGPDGTYRVPETLY